MADSAPPGWIYNETVRMFATPGDLPAQHGGRGSPPRVAIHSFPLAFSLWAQAYADGVALRSVPVAQVPGAATGVTAVAGSKSATVSWTAARDGGSPLTGQSVLVYDDRGRRAGTISIAGSLTSVTITGLAPRKRYSFSIIAMNTVGAGPESSRSNQILAAR